MSHGATAFTASPGDPTRAWFASLAPRIAAARPRAIVVVSAHHVTAGQWAVASSSGAPLLHDHPVTELYAERYSAPDDAALASRIVEGLQAAKLPARLDPQRGLDHGAWLPLRALAPNADIPIVMLSLNARASFSQHVAAGAVLEPLRKDGVLVLASGGVTHNQEEFRKRFFRGGDPTKDAPAWSVGFDEWVTRTLATVAPGVRLDMLATYAERDDDARAHPTPEHFWPVLVSAGAAGADAGVRVHAGFQRGLSMSAFLFGALAV